MNKNTHDNMLRGMSFLDTCGAPWMALGLDKTGPVNHKKHELISKRTTQWVRRNGGRI